jgi:hypothetical protein
MRDQLSRLPPDRQRRHAIHERPQDAEGIGVEFGGGTAAIGPVSDGESFEQRNNCGEELRIIPSSCRAFCLLILLHVVIAV